jgi:hypothetical protein
MSYNANSKFMDKDMLKVGLVDEKMSSTDIHLYIRGCEFAFHFYKQTGHLKCTFWAIISFIFTSLRFRSAFAPLSLHFL